MRPHNRAERLTDAQSRYPRTGASGDAARDIVQVFAGDEGRWVRSKASPAVPGAIAWARVSTEEQAEKGLSVPEQLREIGSYAERHGIEILYEFREAASAFRPEGRRVEFDRMLATANSDPKVMLILVHDFSRFSRDSMLATMLVRELLMAGVRVISVSEPLADQETAAGVFMEAITFAKNEAYSREISFHVRKGCRANVRTRDPETGWCYKNGSLPLWGYRAVNVQRGGRKNRPIIKRIWELDDTVVSGRPVHEWVRHCLVNMAGRGATQRELRRFCESSRLTDERGKTYMPFHWAGLNPSGLLQYCGHAVFGMTRARGKVSVPAAEWVVVPDAHPAIISQEEALSIAATRRVLNNGANTSGPNTRHFLAGGILRCGRCGKAMYTDRGTYCCISARGASQGPACGSTPRVSVSQVESGVVTSIGYVLERLSDKGGAVQEINRDLAAAWQQARRSGAAALAESASSDRSAPIIFSDALAWVMTAGHGATLRPPQAVAAASSNPAPAPRVSFRAAAAHRRLLRKVFRSGDRREQRWILRLWTQTMVMDPERMEIRVSLRIPDQLVSPPGVAEWCAANSPSLRALATRTFTVHSNKR